METRELLKIAYDALDDKKANDIKIIDISMVSSIGDYIIIADGDNKNQLQAMCDSVQDAFYEAEIPMKNREGNAISGWILLDYYDIMIHIFSKEGRSFYDLDHIWRDGTEITL